MRSPCWPRCRVDRSALLIIITGCCAITGCTQPTLDSTDPATETASVLPGTFITVTDPAIQKGVPVTIEFTGPNGYATDFTAYNAEDGSVRVPMPAYMDILSGTFGAGEVTVGIKGAATSLMSVSVDDLPPTEEGPPGTVMRMVLEAAIEQYQYQATGLGVLQADVGTELECASLTAGLDQQITTLQKMIADYDATGRFTVADPTGDLQLTDEQMLLADRLLIAMLGGMASELGFVEEEASKTAATRQKAGSRQPAINPRAAIAHVKLETRRGLAGANVIAAGVGLVGTLAVATGIVVASPYVITVGAIAAVAGAVCSLASGLLGGENSDSFLQRNPRRFNTSLEATSQIVRYGSVATGVIPGPVGTASTVVGLTSGGWDLYNNAGSLKCQKKKAPKKRDIRLMDDNTFQFCMDIGYPPDDSTDDPTGTTSQPAGSGTGDGSGTSGGTDDGEPSPSDPWVPPAALADCPAPVGAEHHAGYSNTTDGPYLEWYFGPDGRLIGPSMEWSSGARTQLRYLECYALGGLREGWSRHWSTTGWLSSETMYAGGLRNGVSRSFLENGRLDTEEHYLNDKRDGTYTRWYAGGAVIMNQYTYKQDALTGPWKKWFSTGQQSGEGDYLNGKRQGMWKDWNEDGQLVSECTYNDGVLVGCRVQNGIVNP